MNSRCNNNNHVEKNEWIKLMLLSIFIRILMINSVDNYYLFR